ncbi:MAG: alpha/beta hydrolase [Chloroflexi bacterium]|nr:alpha/beta hydrolase [Chloroflexota bacterium]
MTTATSILTEEIIEVAGTRLEIARGGDGDPLLVLHDEMGHHGALRWHEALAANNTLHIPSHPGFGESPRMEWIMNMRDLAGWYLRALDELGLQNVNVIGFSLGGWLAAEMATMCPQQFNKMVLVGAAGIKPDIGEIFDIFLVTAEEYLDTVCLDNAAVPEFGTVRPAEPSPEQMEAWLVAREEACRLSWKPYMHYRGLPQLLGRAQSLPTLLIWGAQDGIVPVNAGEIYQQSIKGSRLEVIDNCGHRPEIEQTDEFLALVRGFLAGD